MEFDKILCCLQLVFSDSCGAAIVRRSMTPTSE